MFIEFNRSNDDLKGRRLFGKGGKKPKLISKVECHRIRKNLKIFFEEKEIMKIGRMKKGLFGLTLLLMIFMVGQICLAGQNDGKIGIGRIKISNDDEVVKKTFQGGSSSGKKVILYASFTSDAESSIDGADLPICLPVLEKDSAYMYVAFRVTKATTADIKWIIDGPGSIHITHNEDGFVDPIDGGTLKPGYWYFAWFKLDPSGLSVNTVSSSYTFTGKVSIAGKDDWEDDSCKFQIVK